MPPELHWPYTAENMAIEPSPFVYGFAEESKAIRYIRLDSSDVTGDDALATIRTFLAAGFVCTLGIPVPDSIGDGPEIPFPTLADTVSFGHAVAVVGYDDTLRIRSDKGALLACAILWAAAGVTTVTVGSLIPMCSGDWRSTHGRS